MVSPEDDKARKNRIGSRAARNQNPLLQSSKSFLRETGYPDATTTSGHKSCWPWKIVKFRKLKYSDSEKK